MLMDGLNSLVALVALMLWPAAPAFLILLHLFIGFWRKVGVWTYPALLVLWAFIAGIVYYSRDFLLAYSVDVGALYYLGIALLVAGVLLRGWASSVIGLRGTFGWWEIFPPKERTIVVSGPYKYLKHPIYLSHSLMLFGVFLMTGVLSVGASFVLDLLLANLVIKPLEEKELVERFGNRYSEYAGKAGK